ncbi:hypothetical protein GIV56_01590, partial [Pseudomonas syringae]|nr:hypothetical protein [Pseudomonas syringae]
GLLTGEAADCVGELVFDDLQADPSLVAQTQASAKRLDTFNLPARLVRQRCHQIPVTGVVATPGQHGQLVHFRPAPA